MVLLVFLGLTVLGLGTNATRRQGRAILDVLREGFAQSEAGIGRVEQGIGRVEQGIGRVETNTAETNALLREIRDRLPPRAGG